ncbi:hypothetical protein ACI6Q2_21290 [Chitinophagaceae bacterium LWZ2-11]
MSPLPKTTKNSKTIQSTQIIATSTTTSIPKSTEVSITEVVYDFMMVHVNCSSLQKAGVSYSICNQSNELIRKGNFTGFMVQLRMSHLQDGQYQFNMFVEDKLHLNIPFEKKSLAYTEPAMLHR